MDRKGRRSRKRKLPAKESGGDGLTIYVGNLLPYHSSLHLADYFGYCGTITQITRSKIGPFAFVTYASPDSVQEALAISPHFLGDHQIKVGLARPRPQQQAKVPRREEQGEKSGRNEIDVAVLLDKQNDVFGQMDELIKATKLSAHEMELRDALIYILQTVLCELFPGCTVEAFGSTANGFGVQGCDLDLFLNTHANQNMPKKAALELVKKVRHQIQKNARKLCVIKILMVPASRCPIVKFEYTPMDLHCDLSVKSRLATRNTHLLRMYGECHPCVKILTFAVRYWSKARGVCGSNVVLSSYAVTLLVIVYLQKAGILPSVEKLSRMTEGEHEYVDGWDTSFHEMDAMMDENVDPAMCVSLLRGFFQYYSDLDLSSVVIATRSGEVISRSRYFSKQYTHASFPAEFKVGHFTIQDPFALDHNITKNVSQPNAEFIVKEFKNAAAKVNSGSFERTTNIFAKPADSRAKFGVSLLASDADFTNCTEVVKPPPQIPTTIVISRDVCSSSDALVSLALKFDWLVRMGKFVVKIISHVLLIECDVGEYDVKADAFREALKWNEPLVEKFGHFELFEHDFTQDVVDDEMHVLNDRKMQSENVDPSEMLNNETDAHDENKSCETPDEVGIESDLSFHGNVDEKSPEPTKSDCPDETILTSNSVDEAIISSEPSKANCLDETIVISSESSNDSDIFEDVKTPAPSCSGACTSSSLSKDATNSSLSKLESLNKMNRKYVLNMESLNVMNSIRSKLESMEKCRPTPEGVNEVCAKNQSKVGSVNETRAKVETGNEIEISRKSLSEKPEAVNEINSKNQPKCEAVNVVNSTNLSKLACTNEINMKNQLQKPEAINVVNSSPSTLHLAKYKNNDNSVIKNQSEPLIDNAKAGPSIEFHTSSKTKKSITTKTTYATLTCKCKSRVWQGRNNIKQELTVVQSLPKNLDLEKIITETVLATTKMFDHPLKFTCDVQFVMDTSTLEVRVVVLPDGTKNKEFQPFFWFLNKYILQQVREFFE